MGRKKKENTEDINSSDICYTISIPKPDEQVITNLKAILKGKEKLIMDALKITALPIEEDEDKLTFDWLPTNATQEEIHAVEVLICKMVDLAKTLKRVNLKEKEIPNEKYAFRCFMIRLGMIGDEFKVDRKVLMQNLSGSSAFRMKKEDVVENAVETTEEGDGNVNQ